MNFNQLYRKIAAINDPLREGRDEDEEDEEDTEEVDECGMQIAQAQSEQPSSVSMSLNMNGSGVDGIRDLLDVLKSIDDEGGEPSDTDDKLFGAPDVVIGNEEFANELDDETYDTDRILPTGDDLHSKGGPEPRKPAGGGNPYRQVDENLVYRLTSMYDAIKSGN